MNKRSIYHLVKRYPAGNISALLVAVLLLASCSFEHDGDSDGKTSAALSVTSVSISKPITRSVTAISSGSIGLFCTAYNGYKVQSNVQYTYSSSIWSATTATLLDLPIAEVCAYYPYGAANITSTTDPTSVTLTSQKYSSAQDLSYDSVLVSAYNPKVNFVMNHAYSRITFSITRDVTYGGACAISGIFIANAGIKTGTTLNMISGVYAAGTTGTVSYNPAIASLSSGGSTTTSVLMVPVTTAMTGNMVITFTVDGVPVTANLDVASKGLTTLAAGTNYNIPITVKGAAISIGAVNVTDWLNEVTFDGGDLGKAIVNPQPESNSYIVAPGATISIPVSRVTTVGVTTLTSNWTAGILWGADVLSGTPTIDTSRGYITVTAGITQGNAVVYIKDNSGNIIWSWHIWVTSYDPNTTNLTISDNKWMDRNLGALSNSSGDASYGLFYQWGRKDPFPNSGTTNTTDQKELLYSINHPDTFILMLTTDTGDLTEGSWSETAKTVFDPCPVGWRVPSVNAFDLGLSFTYDVSGIYWNAYGFFPNAGDLGCYLGTNTKLVGPTVEIWTSTSKTSLNAVNGYYNPDKTLDSGSEIAATGSSIRCIKQ
jgi:hypothetical protein